MSAKEASMQTAPLGEDNASATHLEFIEGVRIRLEPSPVGRRMVAACIDIGIITGLIWLVMIPLLIIGGAVFTVFAKTIVQIFKSGIGTAGAVVMIVAGAAVLIALLSVTHIYFIYYEFTRGATPGKKIMGLRVVSIDGKKITKSQAIYRDLVRWYVDLLFFVPGLVTMLCTAKRQRVGDLLAGTLVVYSQASDETAHFIYVKRPDYMALQEYLSPGQVAPQIRDEYLAFASHRFLLSQGLSFTELDSLRDAEGRWVSYIRPLLICNEQLQALQLNDETLMRYFAEYCFQQASGADSKLVTDSTSGTTSDSSPPAAKVNPLK
jgi:uncharacterized RDD family membrane protein YckC